MAVIKIRQTASAIRRPARQREILVGLGLGRIGRVVERDDNPAVRGMLRKVAHMVEIVG